MLLNAKLMDGKIVKVKVNPPPFRAASASIRWIKDEIKDDVHLLPEMQQLYFNGQLLENEQTASYYGIEDGCTIKVIGMGAASAPLHPTQLRLLSSIMDQATTAKSDSRREARARAMRFRAKKAVELEEESTLQLAWDCGAKYKEVDWQMRLRMRTRLLEAGFIEDPTAAQDLEIVLRQRDYLIQRQAGLLKKNGAMVDGFLDELKTMCNLEQGNTATSATFDAALVREASVVRGKIEPTLAVSADIARDLRDCAAQAEQEKQMAKQESEVLRMEHIRWKKQKKYLEADMRRLKLQLDTTNEELLHVRQQVRSTAPDYKTVKEMFNRMDEDGSGVLEPHEVKALCSQLHDLVPLELSAAEMASAVRRLDRDSDGEVNFAEFFAWYEQEMTEAKMRDRPLYSEVKEMFTDMDADGSGELDIGEVKQLAETLLAPVDEASGAPRGFTPTELGDIMTKMDRDGNNTVDFEEFYYWYEQEMEKKAVQLNLQLKMSEFEAEATARAETIQELESNLFEAQKRVDQVQQDAEARIEEVRRAAEAAALERESAMQRSGDEDSDWEPDAPGLPAIGRAATPSTASSKSTGRVHTSRPTLHDAEVAPEAAASKAAARTQKQKPLEARQAEQKEELVKTEKKLSKMEKAREREQLLELAMVDMKAFKKLSLEDKRAVREKRKAEKHKTVVKAKVSADALAKVSSLVCDQCGDRFPAPVEFESDGYIYCSQYCHDEGGWFDD